MTKKNKNIMRFYILPALATLIAIWFWWNYCCNPRYWWIVIAGIILIGHYGVFFKRRREQAMQ
jgi:Flp pilus assembly protein TadB